MARNYFYLQDDERTILIQKYGSWRNVLIAFNEFKASLGLVIPQKAVKAQALVYHEIIDCWRCKKKDSVVLLKPLKKYESKSCEACEVELLAIVRENSLLREGGDS